MEYPWGNKQRFNSYSEYFKREFGERVQKVSVDAGFTCPNRDGTVARGGCTYCNNDAFNPSYCHPQKPIAQQLQEGIEFHQKRYRRANKYLAYFQAYSNTFAPLDHLKKIYNDALSYPGIIGLVIGTRPDCVNEEILEYFSKISKTHYIIIEYGLESCYEKTLVKINRGHTFQQSTDALKLTKSFGLKTGAHIIFGLPGESREEMMAEVEILSALPIDNIKFHQLQIVKGTVMAQQYDKNPDDFQFFELDDYISFIIQFAERLNPDFVIERFTGEVPPRFHAGPNWGIIRNDEVNHRIEQQFEALNTWQGRLYPRVSVTL